MQAALPPKPIHVRASDSSTASAAAASAAAPAAAGHYPPPTPLQTPPYSALRTPRTPALLDAFSKGESTITHFAPPESKAVAEHTLKTLGLAFNMFETYLGCKFPYKTLQTVRKRQHAFPFLAFWLDPDFRAVLHHLMCACCIQVLIIISQDVLSVSMALHSHVDNLFMICAYSCKHRHTRKCSFMEVSSCLYQQRNIKLAATP